MTDQEFYTTIEDALRSLSLTDPQINGVIHFAEYQYSDPRRHYHNLSHIKNCLETFRKWWSDSFAWVNVGKVHPLVITSLLFHDIIYDPTSKMNEINSAIIAEAMMPSVSFANSIAIKMAILKTAYKDKPETTVEKMVCDIDLSGLASDWDVYLKNSVNIINEYLQVFTKDEVKKGRLEFLSRFLDKPVIFYTDNARQLDWDRLANYNMAKELDLLTANMIPALY